MAAGQAGAWLVPAWSGQAIFLVGGVPSLIVTWLMARLPESPRWLISQGRFAGGGGDHSQVRCRASFRGYLRNTFTRWSPAAERWSELRSDFYGTRTLIVWTLGQRFLHRQWIE
jgi:putative MFS transporter